MADEWSSARWTEKEIAPTESKVDCNAGLRCVMEVDSSFRGVLVISVHDHADSTEWCESEVPVRI